MIQVNISEMKNRLSHYIRLARGGEEVEIVDRKTPVARLVHVSQGSVGRRHAPWIQEVIQLGIVTRPNRAKLPAEILSRTDVPGGRKKAEVLKALLDERETGR
jgi:prevent-host-death family protein